jgi:hypothetical protein
MALLWCNRIGLVKCLEMICRGYVVEFSSIRDGKHVIHFVNIRNQLSSPSIVNIPFLRYAFQTTWCLSLEVEYGLIYSLEPATGFKPKLG